MINTVRDALEWIEISADMAETPMTDQDAWVDNIREKCTEALKAIDDILERVPDMIDNINIALVFTRCMLDEENDPTEKIDTQLSKIQKAVKELTQITGGNDG